MNVGYLFWTVHHHPKLPFSVRLIRCKLLQTMKKLPALCQLNLSSNPAQLNRPTLVSFTCSFFPTCRPLILLLFPVCENLAIDDLKKLQDWLLLQIYNTSDTLVGLLQERQQLSEEAHVRLISIEQLHRLLEARCFYRGLSTGLFSWWLLLTFVWWYSSLLLHFRLITMYILAKCLVTLQYWIKCFVS